jgi:hypothetical protein
MQPRPPLVDVLGDGGIGRRRFEEFQRRLADGYEVRPDSLGRDLFGLLDHEAQRVSIERERRRQIADRNADVIENGLHRYLKVRIDGFVDVRIWRRFQDLRILGFVIALLSNASAAV